MPGAFPTLPSRPYLRFGPCWAAALLTLVSCGGERGSGSGAQETATYLSSGEIRRLPDTDSRGSEIWIRHEEIPDFVDMDGEKVGMETMTMPFPLADSGLLEGLEVGDRVEFVFEVNWEGNHPLRLTRIEKVGDRQEGADGSAPEPPTPDASHPPDD